MSTQQPHPDLPTTLDLALRLVGDGDLEGLLPYTPEELAACELPGKTVSERDALVHTQALDLCLGALSSARSRLDTPYLQRDPLVDREIDTIAPLAAACVVRLMLALVVQ